MSDIKRSKILKTVRLCRQPQIIPQIELPGSCWVHQVIRGKTRKDGQVKDTFDMSDWWKTNCKTTSILLRVPYRAHQLTQLYPWPPECLFSISIQLSMTTRSRLTTTTWSYRYRHCLTSCLTLANCLISVIVIQIVWGKPSRKRHMSNTESLFPVNYRRWVIDNMKQSSWNRHQLTERNYCMVRRGGD